MALKEKEMWTVKISNRELKLPNHTIPDPTEPYHKISNRELKLFASRYFSVRFFNAVKSQIEN